MALVASNQVWPVEKLCEATLAFDSSYPTGGESIAASAFGLAQINRIDFNPTGAASGGAGYEFVATIASGGLTANILVFQNAAASGTISKPTFTVEASGAIGTNMEVGLSADSAAATFEGGTGITAQRVLTTTSPVGTPTFTGVAGASTQVPNATNLSAITALPVRVYGY